MIDLDRKLSSNILVFGDPVHPSEKGVDAFVKIITDFLVSNSLL